MGAKAFFTAEARRRGCLHPRMRTHYDQYRKPGMKTYTFRPVGQYCPDCFPPLFPTKKALRLERERREAQAVMEAAKE